MKRVVLFLLLGALAVTLVTAQLVISSFNSNGELSWTNSVSNATYRVEWAGSADGPWQKFDALTNLSLLSASTNLITVKVPTFYRVIWLDAPAHLGTYDYSGFDTQGTLIVTGWLRFDLFQNRTDIFWGPWNLQRAGNSTNPIGPQIGSGMLGGSVFGSNISVELNPGRFDDNVDLQGQLVGNTYTGTWKWVSLAQRAEGPFSAVKRSVSE